MQKTSRMLTLGFGLLSMASLAVPQAIGRTSTLQPASPLLQMQMSKEKVTINGKVSAVSDTSLTVVDSEKAEQKVTIDAKTKITKAGKAAKAADLKADDAVVIVATKGEGDALTAVSIEVS